ncbi:Glycerophosphoryl diester phosphodiesterase [Metalysinibacillus saudimassiliensis]|uniref:Glycerophosphoryl diester phosphodiesterase n=1 Tax=Metalysinibacillus saudimassiliensis TaxID=1461583 RepID=A0A078MJU0_9BACL|nr:Glycerophosphoryl diester phosphodiesterase [Metalysinibacillus saudimassiliensis]
MYNKLDVYAHRGASSTATENTMAAFEEARLLGATGVELDVHFSSDNVPVVFHDESLQRMTGVRKVITEVTIKELMKLKQGNRFTRRILGNRITLFQEVAQWAEQYAIPLNVELKPTMVGNEQAILDFLHTLDLPKGSHISSFDEVLLATVRRERPDIAVALLATKATDWEALKDKNVQFVHAHKRHYKPEKVQQVEKAGLTMRLYGIEGTEDFLAKPHEAIAGYITDYPEQVLAAIKKVKR